MTIEFGMNLILQNVIRVIGIASPIIGICLIVLSIFQILDLRKEYYDENTEDKKLPKILKLMIVWWVVLAISILLIVAVPIGLFVGFPVWE